MFKFIGLLFFFMVFGILVGDYVARLIIMSGGL